MAPDSGVLRGGEDVATAVLPKPAGRPDLPAGTVLFRSLTPAEGPVPDTATRG